MASIETPTSRVFAKPDMVKGGPPRPEAHLAIAAKYAAAEHRHIAAAHALKAGKSEQAKMHADAACGHSDRASELHADIVSAYKFWEI